MNNILVIFMKTIDFQSLNDVSRIFFSIHAKNKIKRKLRLFN
jgi:hypothetical protein